MQDDLTFLHGQHWPDCVASVDKRFDYHTLQLMTRGSVELFYDERRYELDGQWTWTCFPGPWIRFHEWPRGQAWNHRYIACTGPRAVAWESAGLWPRQPEPVTPADTEVLVPLFDQLLELAIQAGRWPRLRAINLLEHILLERAEARQATAPAIRPAWLETVLHQLSAPDAEPDYHRLATSVGLSLTTLRRQFRAATGYSPHQYHLECRMVEARRRLGETDEPVKHIAHQLGYKDVFYFTRQFKQICGVPPAAYRRSRQR